MDKSEVYIIIRWRIYLQSFMFWMRHIAGKKNIVADWSSRMYTISDVEPRSLDSDSDMVTSGVFDSDSILNQVHRGGMFHYGPLKTWHLLGKYFPGPKIPYAKVLEFCLECGRCQNDKKAWVQDIKPVIRTVIRDNHRSRLGIDTISITPADEDGHCAAIVIVNLKTKHVMIYLAKSYDADTAAAAIFVYITRYGLYVEIISGCEFSQ